jgi:uncharacterized protein YqjF (DUF2071 family)
VLPRLQFFNNGLPIALPDFSQTMENNTIPADFQPEHVAFAVMLQSWCDLTFVHWRYPPEAIRAHVPAPLELDLFDGSAWVGLTPFEVRGLRPPALRALPWISHFPETNCRTYVRGPDGHRGVWFFSLDADRAAAVAGARLAYGLPYAWADMRVERTGHTLVYESSRYWPDHVARTHIVVEPGKPIEAGAMEVFLTARFRLYSYVFGRLTYTSVEHAPWPLETARPVRLEQTLTDCAGLPRPEGMPAVHFSRGVDMRIAPPQPVKM